MSGSHSGKKLCPRQFDRSPRLTDFFQIRKRPSTTPDVNDSDKENISPQNSGASHSRSSKPVVKKIRRLTFVKRDFVHPFSDLPAELSVKFLDYMDCKYSSRFLP